jgi:hypothetical protein
LLADEEPGFFDRLKDSLGMDNFGSFARSNEERFGLAS